jgi:hypothetical protein
MFGILHFITLYHTTKSATYLRCSSRLIDIVHFVLGRARTRDKLLPDASVDHPLSGGPRIRKDDESGPYGYGRHHRYLTLWMFALNRMNILKEELRHNDMVIKLAKAIHPIFIIQRNTARPCMRKCLDFSSPLVPSEGNPDPVDGYVAFILPQRTTCDGGALRKELQDHKSRRC